MFLWLKPWLHFAVGAFREKSIAPSDGAPHGVASSARTIAVLCGLTGCALAVIGAAFAFAHADQAGTVAAIMGGVTALVGGGAVALFNKSTPGGDA